MNPIFPQSSFTLFNHLFLGLPLALEPVTHPFRAWWGSRVASIRQMWPKYRSRLDLMRSVMSMVIPSLCFKSEVLICCNFETPKILRMLPASNTSSFRFNSAVNVHVSELCSRTLMIRHSYTRFLVETLICFDLQIFWSLWTTPLASPIRRFTSGSDDPSPVIVPPR